MNLDGVTAKVYRQQNDAEAGDLPSYSWNQIYESYFGERTVGYNRYYTARDHRDQIDLMIEVQPVRYLSTASDRVGIPSEYFGIEGEEFFFRITQIQQSEDDDGLPCTVLSLERVSGLE